MNQRISPAAFDLIIRFETGGQAYYEKVYKSAPCWPGGSSGVTIGAGYDLGYERNFPADWQPRLSTDALQRLARCQGKTGSQAKQALSGVRDIQIPWESALEVFDDRTLPVYIRQTLGAFPMAANYLSADAFGALVSLVFNRGTAIEGGRRKEMWAIRVAILQFDQPSTPEQPAPELHKYVAAQFRSMKRLWTDDPDSDGDLVDRREAEAKLVESCVGA